MRSLQSEPGFLAGRADRWGRRPDIATIFWLIGFGALTYLFSLAPLTPTMRDTELPLLSVPLALLMLAFMLRPRGEMPLYALAYGAVRLSFEPSSNWPFAAVFVALEIVQTIALVWMLFTVFYPRFTEPLMVALWVAAAIALAAAGAALTVSAAQLLPESAGRSAQEFIARPAIAWRNLWLASSCSYLTIAGPIGTMSVLRKRLVLVVLREPHERRMFTAMAAALFTVALVSFPIVDLSWLGLPRDVRLSLCLLPAPFALAMASRFRANGGASAALILAPIVVLSVAGPNAAANWRGFPLTGTPTQAFLLMITTACMVLGAISRQVRMSMLEAIEASEVKSRFIAMMNHELRTPLNAILGFTEFMRLHSQRQLGEAIGSIDNIHASGQRLLAMIEGLLNQADHGAGVFELDKQPLNVRDFVETTVAELRPQFDEHDKSVIVTGEEELTIDADPRALRQVMSVLLSYPLRFLGPDTRIAVALQHSGTDTVIEVSFFGLIHAVADDRDKIELQLASAIALAHGARLTVSRQDRETRIVRLTFFATHAR